MHALSPLKEDSNLYAPAAAAFTTATITNARIRVETRASAFNNPSRVAPRRLAGGARNNARTRFIRASVKRGYVCMGAARVYICISRDRVQNYKRRVEGRERAGAGRAQCLLRNGRAQPVASFAFYTPRALPPFLSLPLVRSGLRDKKGGARALARTRQCTAEGESKRSFARAE